MPTPPRDRDDLARVGLAGLGEHERELVAADPERVVALAQRRLEVRANTLQRLVAGGMPEAVVQLLEAVEVAEHEAEDVAVAHRPRDLAVEPLDERPPVEQARERVVVGEEAHLAPVRGGDDRRRGLVREDAERLELRRATAAGGRRARRPR